MLNADSNFIENRDQEKARCPDSYGDTNLVCGRVILNDLIEHIRDKAAQDKAKSLVDPEGEEYHHAGRPQHPIRPFI